MRLYFAHETGPQNGPARLRLLQLLNLAAPLHMLMFTLVKRCRFRRPLAILAHRHQMLEGFNSPMQRNSGHTGHDKEDDAE